MLLKPIDCRDSRLRQVCAKVGFAALRLREQQLEISGLVDFVADVDVVTTKKQKKAPARPRTIGLSANQVGIMKQICVVDLAVGRRGYSDIHAFVNPEIIWKSRAVISKPEGCVNLPGIWGVVERARTIRVRAWDRSGNEIEMKLTGWPAVLLQHEIDHLNGRLFIDRLPEPKKAHSVSTEDYLIYRRTKPAEWRKFVDVSDMVVRRGGEEL